MGDKNQTKDEYFWYLAVRYEDGVPRAFRTTPDKDKAAEFLAPEVESAPSDPEKTPEPKDEREGAQNPLKRVADRISEVMLSYYALISVSYLARPLFISAFLEGEIVQPLKRGGGTLLEENEAGRLYGLDQSGMLKVVSGREKVRRVDSGTAAKHGSCRVCAVFWRFLVGLSALNRTIDPKLTPHK